MSGAPSYAKTLAEIAIEAGLVTKASAAKAGRIAADARSSRWSHVLIRELGVDEVALIGALRKQTRVPLIDPAEIEVDPEALRLVPRDVCARLRVLPLSVATRRHHEGAAHRDGRSDRHLRDRSSSSSSPHCEIEVTALPLSAIEELVDKGYKPFSTAVVKRGRRPVRDAPGHAHRPVGLASEVESEVSVTAQIPLASLSRAR